MSDTARKPYVHSLQHLNADLLWTRCGLSVNDTPDLPVTEDADTATCPWCFTRTECQRIDSASSISRRPSSDSPMPAASFSASAAWVVPMIPVSGANTPITAQSSSSPSPGGNRQA